MVRVRVRVRARVRVRVRAREVADRAEESLRDVTRLDECGQRILCAAQRDSSVGAARQLGGPRFVAAPDGEQRRCG